MKPTGLLRSSFFALGLLGAAFAVSPSQAAGGPAVVLMNAEPVSLDPMFTQSDANVILSIHEGLYRLDNAGKVVPAVAESIRNVDPLTWEIKIRRGLTFHNGEPIDADAVVFTFDRAKKLFAAGKGDLTFALGALKYDRVEKIDDSTVRFVMQEPDPIITSHLVNPEVSILPPKYYTENPPEKVVFAPVGAGGYKFVSYKAGEGLVLKAFDKYRLGKPPVEDVIVKAVPEVATRIERIESRLRRPDHGRAGRSQEEPREHAGREGRRRAELPAPLHRHQAGPPSGARGRARAAGDEPRHQLRGDRGLAHRRHGDLQHRPRQHALQQSRS